MKFAYADPPYFGCGKRLYGRLHERAADWDDIETHREMIAMLCNDYPDGWAMSLNSTGLHITLPLCPPDVRIGAWVKPFCAYKKNVTLAYAWEPVIIRGGRKRPTSLPTVKDFTIAEESPAVAANITMQTGCPGAKPEAFCMWLFDVLGIEPTDEFVDLFPGSGNVGRAWEKFREVKPLFQTRIAGAQPQLPGMTLDAAS